MSSHSQSVYRLRADKVDIIVCHKYEDDIEHYLIRWKPESDNSQKAVLSWHHLSELSLCMAYVQDYLKAVQSSSQPLQRPRKRKSPSEDDSSSSRSTPSSSHLSREYEVFNGVIRLKAGYIVAQEKTGPYIPRVDATSMPDASMLAKAKGASIFYGLTEVRNAFLRQLARLPGPSLSFKNLVDTETPSLHFKWITDYALGEGVERSADVALEGCQKCRPDMGLNRGCEYTAKCGCLEFAAPDEKRVQGAEQKLIYEAWVSNEPVDTSGLPKKFPYTLTSSGLKILQPFYLDSRHIIYECNKLCRCGPNCKTRNVQHGRTIPLEIFKTETRGFGLRCRRDLKKGQFIDNYLGELITDAEADRREAAAGAGRDSYLFWLDKHMIKQDDSDSESDEDESDPDPEEPDLYQEKFGLQQEDCFVADGAAMGGPTRFINHSCDPNTRIYTASYNKYDERIYDLAFFAIEDIPAGTELTFDYMDADPDQDEKVAAKNKEKKVRKMEKSGKKSVRCLCGADNCRGKMWE